MAAAAAPSAAPTRQLLFACAWGQLDVAGGRYPLEALPALLDRYKALGYAGIEIPIAFVMRFGSKRFEAVLLAKGMRFVAQIFSSGAKPSGGPPTPGNLDIASQLGFEHAKDPEDARNVAAYCAIWAAQLRECAALRPVLHSVTSHTGKDYFTENEADEHFAFSLALEKELDVEVNHETHRARILYSPWVVPRILAKHPELRLCADLSHFSVVAESGPHEPEINRVVALLAPRVRHVHARVGFEEGPQILDPRLPAWAPYLEGYKLWWRAIYEASKARGDAVFSTTPEFGPPVSAASAAAAAAAAAAAVAGRLLRSPPETVEAHCCDSRAAVPPHSLLHSRSFALPFAAGVCVGRHEGRDRVERLVREPLCRAANDTAAR